VDSLEVLHGSDQDRFPISVSMQTFLDMKMVRSSVPFAVCEIFSIVLVQYTDW